MVFILQCSDIFILRYGECDRGIAIGVLNGQTAQTGFEFRRKQNIHIQMYYGF